MKRRVFIAIRIDKELQERILAWQRAHDMHVRWLAGKNLHVTLVPPWYEEDVDNVRRKLQQLRKSTRFAIAFNNISFGPPRQPRLIWAVGEMTKEMFELQNVVEGIVGARIQKRPRDRRFELHLTLARFRPEDFSGFPVRQIDERIDWRSEVRSIALMESHLLPAEADYEVLEEIALNKEF